MLNTPFTDGVYFLIRRVVTMINGLYVQQRGQQYAIFTPQGIQIGLLFLGQDGQYAKDVAALGPITKALAKRWGVNPKD